MHSSGNDGVELHRKSFRVILLIYSLLIIALDVMVLSAPLPVLLDRFIPDDAFYYYNTARNLVNKGFSTFDGLNFTNGYQPLWFLANVPVFWLFPGGGELPLRLLWFIQIPLSVVATAYLIYVTGRLFGPLAAGVTGVVWVVVFQRVMINGLEVALQMSLYAACLAVFLVVTTGPARPSAAASLGVISSFVFLARTDGIFLIAGLALFSLLQTGGDKGLPALKRSLAHAGLFMLPVLLIVGGYLSMNWVHTGHLMPVSGAAKQFHSEMARQLAIGRLGSTWLAYAKNVVWPFEEPGYRFLAVGLLGPVFLAFLSYWSRLRALLWPFRRFWPFYVGIWGSFLFYSIMFYGGFTRTLWYYGPAAMWACIAAAGACKAMDELFPFRGVPGLSGVLLVGLVLGWLKPLYCLYAMVAGAGGSLVSRYGAERGCVPFVGAVAAFALLFATYKLHGINLDAWLVAALGVVCIGASSPASGREALHAISVVGLVALTALTIHGTNLKVEVTSSPGHWNYNLYLGALWARDNLPVEATIWSGSAGILGYFSERTVVNTDGLANSYDFLDNVLKAGHLPEYQRRWDYAIDAFPDEELSSAALWGRPIPLPTDLTRYSFKDGELTRRLRVFEMRR